MFFLEYTHPALIALHTILWLLIACFAFASLIKGSDYVKAKTGYWNWWVFRKFYLVLLFLSALYLYQVFLLTVPIFLIDVIKDTVIATFLIWRFIYKRIITKDWNGSHRQTTGNRPVSASNSLEQSQQTSHTNKLAKAKRVLSELQSTTSLSEVV